MKFITTLSLVSVLMAHTALAAAANPFDQFVGDYKVLERSCTTNGNSAPDLWSDLTEFKVLTEGSGFYLRRVFQGGFMSLTLTEGGTDFWGGKVHLYGASDDAVREAFNRLPSANPIDIEVRQELTKTAEGFQFVDRFFDISWYLASSREKICIFKLQKL